MANCFQKSGIARSSFILWYNTPEISLSLLFIMYQNWTGNIVYQFIIVLLFVLFVLRHYIIIQNVVNIVVCAGYQLLEEQVSIAPLAKEPLTREGKKIMLKNVSKTSQGVEITIHTSINVQLEGVTIETPNRILPINNIK
ncbi:hypothetical protein [Paenibacillus antarcticus]|uniref:Uncharacterized protein n=1 Tax=Paenibacillus antarcticus TaxID=253703 RepID=A0A168PGY2_9BACL|nr:hypothetical protein [Paenibacillus antarcticus]OAB46749.1 hypothetical protein PBAT_08720 [Paenibacillus antarcticus]